MQVRTDKFDSEAIADAALRDRIAPAMKSYFEWNAVLKTIGVIAFVAFIVFEFSDRFDLDGRYENLKGVVAAFSVVAMFVSQPFVRRAAISSEVQYFRRHGKWRWER